MLSDSLIYVADYNFYGDNYNYTHENGAYYLGTADNPYFMLCGFEHSSEIQQIHPDTKIILATSGHNGTQITIPDGVTVIMRLHLKYSEGAINKLHIPASVKYLYEGAFSQNTEVTFENSELTYSEYVNEYYHWKQYRGPMK